MRAYQDAMEDAFTAMLRVAKPGAHLLAFGGTRTFHRLTCAIEDAGWEIRDCVGWLYGSGFPKSLDVSKAIDKAAGAEREIVGRAKRDAGSKSAHAFERCRELEYDITAPATDAARQWSGWGTALKPAWEPVILARAPLAGTVAATVCEYGTGALNIDGCRIGTATIPTNGWKCGGERVYGGGNGIPSENYRGTVHTGRWPANLIHDGSDEALALFPQTGPSKASMRGDLHGRIYGNGKGPSGPDSLRGHNDAGGSTARFFYCAKSSRAERGEGNVHPTVKPLALMRYLCRLITPPGGLVLDPFAGSGSTLIAAVEEGFEAVGIERDEAYAEIARQRLAPVRAVATLDQFAEAEA
jgi:site-specific DNA-methyltransferase (adenine-specific)